MRAVDPTRTPAGYIGGKRGLAKRITAVIETVPHRTYAEAFVGMGGVFLKRRSAPPAEVINDMSGDVATLFRVLQRHYTAFMDMLRYQITSRREFDRLKGCDPATLTDLERAARFLYLQRLAFGGKVSGRNFGVVATGGEGARFNVLKLAPVLEEVHERLAGVVIEQLPWQRFLERYDRPGTLFYLDPPYWGGEGDYGPGMFGREDFADMAARLAKLKGRFILSINDVPDIRAIFSGFTMEAVETTYSLAGGGKQGKRAAELIITGPPSSRGSAATPRSRRSARG
jgi:DNA adenine methylase